MNFLEKIAANFLTWRLRVGYGARCPDRDENVLTPGGCYSCKARVCIELMKELTH